MELPTMMCNAAVSHAYKPAVFTGGIGWSPDYEERRLIDQFHNHKIFGPPTYTKLTLKTETKVTEQKFSRRVVKIFIIDPDANIELKDAILHQGPEELTDLTDQELFFELDIKQLLKEHNEKRVKLLNKKAAEKAGKDVFLEAIKVRDLTMVVNVILSF